MCELTWKGKKEKKRMTKMSERLETSATKLTENILLYCCELCIKKERTNECKLKWNLDFVRLVFLCSVFVFHPLSLPVRSKVNFFYSIERTLSHACICTEYSSAVFINSRSPPHRTEGHQGRNRERDVRWSRASQVESVLLRVHSLSL